MVFRSASPRMRTSFSTTPLKSCSPQLPLQKLLVFPNPLKLERSCWSTSTPSQLPIKPPRPFSRRPSSSRALQFTTRSPGQHLTLRTHTHAPHFFYMFCVLNCFCFAFCRYLSHRVLPIESKKSRFALKRMSKRFGLIGEGKE